MPHVILQSPLSLEQIGGRFRSMPFSESGIQVKFIEAYLSFDNRRLLIDTYVSEEPLDQRIGLLIRRRKTDDLVISLHDVGFSRPTAGIQLAIKLLSNWIVELHPGAEILRHNLKITPEMETWTGSR